VSRIAPGAPAARLARRPTHRMVGLLALVAAGALAGLPASHAQDGGLAKINHVIVIYQENWSFDGLYRPFPRADGLANAGETGQRDRKADEEGGTAVRRPPAAARHGQEAAGGRRALPPEPAGPAVRSRPVRPAR